MQEYVPLLIQLASGALGGNLAGKLLRNHSLGTIGNSIAGILGGGLGGWILEMIGFGEAKAAMDLYTILGSIVGGAVGGGLIMALLGALKKAFVK